MKLIIKETQNPTILKFEFPEFITKGTNYEFKNIDEANNAPLVQKLFYLPFVKTVYVSGNFIAIERFSIVEWDEITLELRTFIKQYLENGGIIVDESLIPKNTKQEKQQIKNFDHLDVTSQQIINILEEYVKPAVAADGGNILFDSFDEKTKQVKVVLQGSCNGCPSSTFTLKNGIENMLKSMLNDNEIVVEALNR